MIRRNCSCRDGGAAPSVSPVADILFPPLSRCRWRVFSVMPWHVHPQAQWNRFWLDDLDDLHHAEILVVEDMAVQDELADIVRVAGIDVHGLRNYLAIRP